MTITYPLPFPTNKGVASVLLGGTAIVGVSTSGFTGEQYVQAHSGRFWSGGLVWPTMKRSNAEQIIAFLLSLNGMQGTFLMGDPNGATPRGTASSTPGVPVVQGASQTGLTLDIDGIPAGESGYMLQGDYFQLGSGASSSLHKLTKDADTNSAGEVTLDFWPNLRTAPSNNAPLTVSDAKGLWRLATNTIEWDIDTAAFYGLSVPIREAF